ncbi:hypothetical protein BsIDN1_13530 [Bacillus safensis]|uniref:Uncharacterized protein n=1 Tax=Bacillus safensis TaxID=561879 RepID=A0A5S9M4K0_BACIA|nr:hypothetical protein BsIDN1_13530 [Bacillus safensis]
MQQTAPKMDFYLRLILKKEDYVLVGMIEGVKNRGGSGLVVQKMKPVIASFLQITLFRHKLNQMLVSLFFLKS